MKRLKLLLIVTAMMSSTALTGCSLLTFGDPVEQPTYIPPGCVAEVATLARVECWITNTETGKREKRMIEAQPGYWLGRPRTLPIGQSATPVAKGVTGRTTRVGPHEFDMPIEQMPEWGGEKHTGR